MKKCELCCLKQQFVKPQLRWAWYVYFKNVIGNTLQSFINRSGRDLYMGHVHLIILMRKICVEVVHWDSTQVFICRFILLYCFPLKTPMFAWREPLSSTGSTALILWQMEGRHLNSWGSALHQVCFSGMDWAAALGNTLCISEATLKAARQVNQTDGLWLTHLTSYTPQRAVWLSMPASRGDAVPALYTLCVPLQACVSSFISETFMICWGHVMWQVHNKKTIAMKNRVKYFKWHPKSIYASQVAQW